MSHKGQTYRKRIAVEPSEYAGLSTKDAGNYLGIPSVTLSKMRREGTGPPYYRLAPARKAKVFYRKQDLDIWIKNRQAVSLTEERTNPHWSESPDKPKTGEEEEDERIRR